jgi:hypothetical protein
VSNENTVGVDPTQMGASLVDALESSGFEEGDEAAERVAAKDAANRQEVGNLNIELVVTEDPVVVTAEEFEAESTEEDPESTEEDPESTEEDPESTEEDTLFD